MATADRILMLKLLGDTSSIDKSLRKTEGRLKGMGRSALSWGKAFTAGLVIEGIDKVTEALGDAWTGFREGEQAAAQLGTTWKNLGLDGSRLQGTIDAISESTLKLGTDDTEAINAFNQALQNTGGKPTEAMKRLRIAQDLVANGSAPSLTSALKLIDRAASGSATTVRKFGLTSDTAAGRVKELARKVRGSAKAAADADPLRVFFNSINEDLEGIVGSLSQGDLDGALSAMRDIGKDLNALWDKIGPKIVGVLDKLSGGSFSDVLAKFQRFADDVGPKVGKAFDAIATAWGALQPHLQNALTIIQPLVDILSNTVAGGLGFVLDAVAGSLNTVASLLKGDIPGAVAAAQETIGKLGEDLNTMFSGLPDRFFNEWIPDIAEAAGDLGSSIVTSAMTFVSELPGKVGDLLVGEDGLLTKMQGAVETLGGVAMDIGRSILDGVVKGLAGIVGRVVGIIQSVASGIVRVWNSLGTFPAGGFTFAEAFDVEIAGQHFGWPKLAISWGAGDLIPNIGGGGGGRNQLGVPGYKKGLWDVPVDNMAAILHKGESVVPADFAQQLRANGGFGGGGSTYNINVHVAPGGDAAETGRRIVQAIKAFERRDGKVWRTA